VENITVNRCAMKVHAGAAWSEILRVVGAGKTRRRSVVEKEKRWIVLWRTRALGLDVLIVKMFARGMWLIPLDHTFLNNHNRRLFDCGVHKCQQLCHPPSFLPTSCPRSLSKITHCPCGTHPIASSPSYFPDTNPITFPARTHCTSPVPTCPSTCGKAQPNCDHPCAAKCHTGPCPPCSVSIVRPCRCGGTTRSVRCFELRTPNDSADGEILCDKPCAALRACGRHQCRRLCCPLASLSSGAGKKGKRRGGGGADVGMGVGEEQGGLHECDLICGKPLGCGNHTCEERDHKGVCPQCLRSSFEEVIMKLLPYLPWCLTQMLAR
jgi:hypothetical protein